MDLVHIITELGKKGHKVRNISCNIRHRVIKDTLLLFFVDPEPASNNQEIYKIEYIQSARIRFEPPHKKREIDHCKRCQRYGHTKIYCMHPLRGVKCVDCHASTNCTRTKDTSFKCALTERNHNSNYKGCTVYKEIRNRWFPPLDDFFHTLGEKKNTFCEKVSQVVIYKDFIN